MLHDHTDGEKAHGTSLRNVADYSDCNVCEGCGAIISHNKRLCHQCSREQRNAKIEERRLERRLENHRRFELEMKCRGADAVLVFLDRHKARMVEEGYE